MPEVEQSVPVAEKKLIARERGTRATSAQRRIVAACNARKASSRSIQLNAHDWIAVGDRENAPWSAAVHARLTARREAAGQRRAGLRHTALNDSMRARAIEGLRGVSMIAPSSQRTKVTVSPAAATTRRGSNAMAGPPVSCDVSPQIAPSATDLRLADGDEMVDGVDRGDQGQAEAQRSAEHGRESARVSLTGGRSRRGRDGTARAERADNAGRHRPSKRRASGRD